MHTAVERPHRPRRGGFTLVELLVAMVLLIICALGMSFASMRFSQKIGDSTIRTRAQSLADVQIALARTWPTYGTLEDLQHTRFNTPVDGLNRATTVVMDTTGGINLKRLTVTISSVDPTVLQPDVVRSITLAAP
jgi:prepilin-type N-terminal cleavage/methylation domain-containing protein